MKIIIGGGGVRRQKGEKGRLIYMICKKSKDGMKDGEKKMIPSFSSHSRKKPVRSL